MIREDRLRLRGSLRRAVHRVALFHLDRALEALDDPERDIHLGTHEVRQRCKQLRALLGLIGPALEGPAVRRNLAFVRGAQRLLSGMRDRAARIEAIEDLRARASDPLEIDACRVVRHELGVRQELWIASEGDRLHQRRQEVREGLQSVRDRVPDWCLDRRGFASLRPGLRRAYRRGRRALDRVLDQPSMTAVHEWRKRVKEHLHHVRMLQRLHPARMKARRRSLHDLAEELGQVHDLGLLREHLRAEPIDALEAAAHSALEALIDREVESRLASACHQGRLMYAERPRALARLWGAWFRIQRQDARRRRGS